MGALIWGGAGVAMLGVVGLLYCGIQSMKARWLGDRRVGVSETLAGRAGCGEFGHFSVGFLILGAERFSKLF